MIVLPYLAYQSNGSCPTMLCRQRNAAEGSGWRFTGYCCENTSVPL